MRCTLPHTFRVLCARTFYSCRRENVEVIIANIDKTEELEARTQDLAANAKTCAAAHRSSRSPPLSLYTTEHSWWADFTSLRAR